MQSRLAYSCSVFRISFYLMFEPVSKFIVRKYKNVIGEGALINWNFYLFS